MKNKEVSLEEIMNGLDLYMSEEEDGYEEEYIDDNYVEEEYIEREYKEDDYSEEDYSEEEEYRKKFKKEREDDESKFHKRHKCHKCRKCHKPIIKINSDLEVNIGNENKTIYVSHDKIQYFTANAICSSSEIIEIEYSGSNTKCICGETFIFGRLGFYKIVKSGIIFIPKCKFHKTLKHCNLSDILHFKAKSKCGNEIEFVVVFTFFKDKDCKCHCDK